MGALIAGVVIAVVSASSGIVAAFMARRSQQEANRVKAQAVDIDAKASFREDFVAFVGELKQQVDRQGRMIEDRDRQIDECEAGRREDRERIHILEGRVSELGG